MRYQQLLVNTAATFVTMLVVMLCSAKLVIASQPIVIGLDADMSSVAVEGGQAIKRGALLAIDEINARGGILNRQVVLEISDHRGNPARGIKNIEAYAKNPNLLAVLGGVHTPVALAELPYIHKHQLIYLGPWAAGTSIIDNDYSPNFVFRISVRDAEAAKVMLRHAAARGISRIALALERTGWGRSNLASLQQHSEAYGISIVSVQWINWRQQDFQQEMRAIAQSDAQALFMVVNAPEGVVIANTMVQLEKPLPMISHWGIAGGDFAARIGLSTLNQLDFAVLQTFSFERNPQDEINQRVFNAYRNRFDTNAQRDSILGVVGLAHAYDLIHIIAKAAEQAGTLDANAVKAAMENLSEHQGLIKQYIPPFTPTRHDALFADDYFMSRFNALGHLEPYPEVN
ncbi:ABC transporter substrate-binding protein [Aestuariibacter sp. GS-14]|uniref:ABC transporter substrate-binding protein n=1 Tax=Aestuariibacter sp. GS-14 TaxID=2590670 RepID=UPI002103E4B4|nr:ABC transporter substrate-binding protein [Aestuariibacter sp. GS-14]